MTARSEPRSIGLVWFDAVVAAGCLMMAWGIGTVIGEGAADDCWIVLRYVRNLLEGHGWCYEVGVRVNASTSAANTLLITAAGWLLGDLRAAQNAVFAMGLGGGASALYAGFRDVSLGGLAGGGLAARIPGLVVAVLVLTTPLFWTVFGLESPVLIGALAGAWWASLRSRFVLCAALCALLALTRPEGVLLPPVLVVDRWIRHRDVATLPWIRMLLVFALPVAAWAGFSWVEFGAIVPDTLAAKRAQAESGWWDHHLFFKGAKRSLALFSSRDLQLGYKPFLGVLGVSLIVTAIARHRVLALVAWVGLVCAGYSILAVPFYHWYGVPLHLGMVVMLGVVFDVSWRAIGRSGLGRSSRVASRGFALILFGTWVGLQMPRPSAFAPMNPHYREAAEWIDTHASPQSRVGAVEIGQIGYKVWPRGIVDACGLVTRDVVPDMAAGRFGVWFERHRPEYVVLHIPPVKDLETSVESSPEFAGYREVFRSSDGLARVVTRVPR